MSKQITHASQGVGRNNHYYHVRYEHLHSSKLMHSISHEIFLCCTRVPPNAIIRLLLITISPYQTPGSLALSDPKTSAVRTTG